MTNTERDIRPPNLRTAHLHSLAQTAKNSDNPISGLDRVVELEDLPRLCSTVLETGDRAIDNLSDPKIRSEYSVALLELAPCAKQWRIRLAKAFDENTEDPDLSTAIGIASHLVGSELAGTLLKIDEITEKDRGKLLGVIGNQNADSFVQAWHVWWRNEFKRAQEVLDIWQQFRAKNGETSAAA